MLLFIRFLIMWCVVLMLREKFGLNWVLMVGKILVY